MVRSFLLPESVAQDDGQGATVALGTAQGKPLLLTLRITRILEQETLDVSIWGSADGQAWRALAAFPPKCYCGTYTAPLDLSNHRDVGYLRTEWKMTRWDRGRQKPVFDFYVSAEERKTRAAGA